jgi:hypothetical protein
VGESRGVGEVIHGDEFDLGIVQSGADDIPANAAEAVDTNFHGHVTDWFSLRIYAGAWG